MKMLARVVVITTFSLIALYVIAIYFSAKQSVYKCDGRFEKYGNQEIFLNVSEYRFWVHLWSKHDADIKVEIPNKNYDYFNEVRLSGDLLQITKNGMIVGQLSKLSGALILNTSNDLYEGNCHKVTTK